MIGRNGIIAICAAFAIALLILFSLPIPQNAGQNSTGLSALPDIVQNPDFLQKPNAAAQATASEQAQGASGAVNSEGSAEGPEDPESGGANASGSNSSESTAVPAFSGGGYSGGYAAGPGAAGTFAVEQEGQQANDAQSKIDADLQQEIEETAKENPEGRIRIIIQISNENELQKIAELASQKGGENTAEYKTGKLISLEIPADEIAELTSENLIIRIFPEMEVKAFLSESSAQINAQSAYDLNFTGNGIKIAILDTGINAGHEMLPGKIIASASFVNDENSSDFHGHGTHVAGIAAGTDIYGAGYRGIAPNALLLNAKVLNKYGSGTTTGVIAGINWAVENGAKIINLSLGANYSKLDDPINLAIKGAVEKGVVVVAASGNCGACGNCGSFRGVPVPGDSAYAISVGAVDKSNNYTCFSSGNEILGIGTKPDVSAPGVNINSAFNDSYASQSGTSMAAPHVSGAIALLLEAKPDLKPADIKAILEQSAVDLGAEGKDTEYGSGMINIAKLLDFNSSLAPQIRAISILPYELLPNEATDIIVNAWDDENIAELQGTITNPDNEIFVLDFAKITENRWFANFSQTQVIGNYEIKITATDNSGLIAGQKANFEVIASIDYNAEASLVEPAISQSATSPIQETAFSKDSVSAEFLIDNPLDNFCTGANPNFNIGTSRYSGLEYLGDIDWFKGYVSQKSLLKFYLYPPNRNYDYGFAVYSSCNNTLLGNCDKAVTGNEICYITVPQGYYYVKVYSKSSHYSPYYDYKLGLDNYCSSTQCTSFYWKECYNSGSLCCEGDKPKTDQYYCASDTSWKKCTDASRSACEKQGDYYCTNDSYWAWRPCANGCDSSTGKCKTASTCEAKTECIDDYTLKYTKSDCSFTTEPCIYGCDKTKNACKFAPKSCTKAGDCGTDGYSGSTSCPYGKLSGVYQQYKTYSCINSTCSETSELKLFKDCSANEICSNGSCASAPYTEQWLCKDTYTRVYRLKDGSYKSGSESTCANGCEQSTGNCKNFSCPQNNCASSYWNTCIPVNELCCTGDDTDADSASAFGQFYCKADEQFAKCTEMQHTACEKQGNYYCAADSDGLWKFRACDYGCNESTGKCNESSAIYIRLDDAVSKNTAGISLFKQAGDFLTVKLRSANTQTIKLTVPDAALYSGSCSSSSFAFSGRIECIYRLGSSTGTKTAQVQRTNGALLAEARFEVMTNPNMLIITDRTKLLERFNNDSKGIQLLMETAYSTALYNRAVIYDLSKYGELPQHPFSSFASYNENPSSPSKSANDYVSKAANFIKSKCKSCKKVLILGDDFIVPHSRQRSADVLYYSDSTYAMSKTISITKPFVLFENKNVLMIVPDVISNRLRNEINALKQKISDKYGSLITEVKASEINTQTCRLLYSNYSLLDRTAIFIGDRGSNPAINCALPNKKKQLLSGMAMIRPSPWQSSTTQTNYALLLIDANAASEADNNFNAIKGFMKMIDSGAAFEKITVTDVLFFVGYMALNVIPVIELGMDAIDVAESCTPVLMQKVQIAAEFKPLIEQALDDPNSIDKTAFAEKFTSLIAAAKEPSIDDVLCGIMVLASGYDVTTYAGYATGIGAVVEIVGDISFTSVKFGLRTFVKELAGMSKDALKTLTKKAKDIPTFFKSAGLWNDNLKLIERTYGSETKDAVAKLVGRITEEEADDFMGYAPRLVEMYGKENIQSVAKIAEKYALELDGEAAEALAKAAKKICPIISASSISIASTAKCYPEALEGIAKVMKEIAPEGSTKAAKEAARVAGKKAAEIISDAAEAGLKWSSEGAEGLTKIIAKEGAESAVVKNIDKLKSVKGIDGYSKRLADSAKTTGKLSDGIKYEAELNAKLLDKGYKIEEVSIPAKRYAEKYGFKEGEFDSLVVTPDGKKVLIETKSGDPREIITYKDGDPQFPILKTKDPDAKSQLTRYKTFANGENINEIWIVFKQTPDKEVTEAINNFGGITIKLESEII